MGHGTAPDVVVLRLRALQGEGEMGAQFGKQKELNRDTGKRTGRDSLSMRLNAKPSGRSRLGREAQWAWDKVH